MPGAHNYQEGKSKITINHTELESLLKENVGKGDRIVGEIGYAGYKERVDFKKIIGEYAVKNIESSTIYSPTTKGIIIYAEDGMIHVHPSHPLAIIL